MTEHHNQNDYGVAVDSSAPAVVSIEQPQQGIIKEGWAFKRANRARRGWNKQYFVLKGDVLSYYVKKNKEDSQEYHKPKGQFIINESSCTISDVYIQERRKYREEGVLYCIKLKWSEQQQYQQESVAAQELAGWDENYNSQENSEKNSAPTTTITESSLTPNNNKRSFSHNDDSRSEDSAQLTPPRNNHSSLRRRGSGLWTPQLSNSKLGKFDSKSEGHIPSPIRYDSPPRLGSDQDGNHGSSEEYNNIGIKSIISTTPTKKERSGMNRLRRSSRDMATYSDEIVASKQKGQIIEQSHRSTSGSGPPSPPMSPVPSFDRNNDIFAAKTPTTKTTIPKNNHQEQLQQQKTDEADKELYASYLASKKEKRKNRKKRVIKGTKIAAAAGATVTAGVLTAGVGLLAGMLFLSVGAAAGGTGVAAEKGLKRKQHKSKEMIMAFTTLEDAKRWLAALNACIESQLVKGSTWGQLFAMGGRNTTMLLVPTKDAANSGIKTTVATKTTPRNFAAVTDSHITSDERQNVILMDESSTSDSNIQWQPLDGGWATWMGAGAHGMRLFREGKTIPTKSIIRSVLDGRPCPPHKAQLVLNASPLTAFLCLMSHNCCIGTGNLTIPNASQRTSFRVIESVDDHADIIHLVFRPLYLFPSWTLARDFVLYRYWRLDDDGSYVVCYDSVTHENCPLVPGYVRGVFHGVYTIAPPKIRPVKKIGSSGRKVTMDNVREECLMTAVVQIDPRGWVPNVPLPLLTNQGHGEAFAVAALLQMLDIQDALDQERFVSTTPPPQQPSVQPVAASTSAIIQSAKESNQIDDASLASLGLAAYADSMQPDTITATTSFNYDFTYSERESRASLDSLQGFASQPPSLPLEYWAEPDSNSFFVRGKNYLMDRKKIHSGSSIGRLVAVDAVRVEKPILTGMCTHPTERMQQALEREHRLLDEGFHSDLAPYFFVVNISIPGFHMVFYFAVEDMSRINGTDGTPESKLANEFFFGPSDKMRDTTFKLIPQIVVGNFLVRRAVGTTPCIMAKALKQLYVKGDRFFEVILDCGSSAVATGAVRLSLTYAETMIVDMGFLFEGNDESTLPEKLFGCVRMKHVPFDSRRRFVKQPPSNAAKAK